MRTRGTSSRQTTSVVFNTKTQEQACTNRQTSPLNGKQGQKEDDRWKVLM